MTMRQKQATLLVAGLGGVVLGLLLLSRTNVHNPVFRGKRVSVWFEELCFFGVFGNRSNAGQFHEVYDAFSRMGPDAVPYLTRKLRYLRYGPTDKVFLWIKRNRLMRPYTK